MSARISILILLLALWFGAPLVASADDSSTLIAKVGSVPITSFDLKREIDKIMPFLVSFHGKVSAEKAEEIKQKALDNLIEQSYKVCYAKDNQLTVTAEKVTEVIETARKKMKPEVFERAVAAETMEELRASVERKLLADAAEVKAVVENIAVSDQQVKDYFQQNKKSFFRPRQFRASHILIKVDPALSKDNKLKLKEKAESLLALAKAGEDFYDLAYFNSDDRTKFVGGDLGLFHEGQTVPEFESALQKLQVGEVSELVKTLYGYHIIKLTERNEPRQLEFAEVEARIRSKLEEKQQKQLYEAWLAPLKKNYPVENYLR